MSSVSPSTETPGGASKARRVVLGLLGVVAVVASAAVTVTPVAASTRAATSTNGFAYTGINPFRAEDTRTDGKTLGPGGIVNVTVAGGTTGVPSTAKAVAATVTVTDTTSPGYVTAFPAGGTQPTASNQNWTVAGATIAARAVVGVGSNGQISVYNFAGSTDVVVDVDGYFSAATSNSFGHYVALGSPVRVADTRNTFQTIAPNSSQDFYISGALNPTTGVQAAVLNVTVTNTQAPGFLTITPKGSTAATTSMLNWGTGETIADRYNALLGTGGYITVFNGSAGSTDVVIDASGYYADATGGPGVGALFNPLSGPTRILDTRSTGNSLATNSTQSLTVTGTGGIPSGATAVEQNLTVTNTNGSSYLAAYPNSRPLVSDVNWLPGWTIANSATTTLNSSGAENFYNLNGSADLVVDASGYYSPAPGVQVTANPASVPADAATPSQIDATVTDANGNPVVGDTLSFSLSGSACTGSSSTKNAKLSSSTGTTGSNGAMSGTGGSGTITYTPSDTVGTCTVNAVEAKFGQTGNVTITQTAVKNKFSTPLSCTPATVPANGSATAVCSGTIQNGVTSAAVSGDTVTFAGAPNPAGACGSFNPTSATTDSSGNFSTTYTASSTVGFCTITATESGTGNSSSTTETQTVNPTPATSIAASSNPGVVPANGTATSTILVQVCTGTATATSTGSTTTTTVTQSGSCASGSSPVVGDYVNLSASSATTGGCGTLSATNGTTNSSGQFTATYTASTTGTGTSSAPGTTCTITAREANGGQSTTTTVQQYAPPRSLSASANPSTVPADGTSTSTITVTAKDQSGNAASGDTITFSTVGGANPTGACGSVTASSTTNSAGTATATYTASAVSGFCTISIADTTAGGSTSVTITQTSAGPSSVTVAANPTSVPADGSTTSTITATVKNSSGGAVAGDIVAFTTSGSPSGACGTVDTVSGTPTGATNSSGQTTAVYHATTTVGTCTITATEATGGHSGSTTVTQTAVPNTMQVTASCPTGSASCTASGSNATVPANGASTVTYTINVKQGATNVSGDTVTVAPSGQPAGACGSITPTSTTTNSSGNATFTYTANGTNTQGFCKLTFTESGTSVSGTGTVTQTSNPTPTTSAAISPADTTGCNATTGASLCAVPSLTGDAAHTATFTVQVCSGTGATFGTGAPCGTGGSPVANDLVRVYFTGSTTYCGSLSAGYVTTNSSGQATVTYTSANNTTTSNQTCTLQAQEANGGATTGSATVVQTPRPRNVTVTANPTTIAHGSTQTSTITATVTDSNGNPVNGDTVSWASSANPTGACGTLTPASTTTNSSGQVTATLAAGTVSGFCTVTVTDTTVGGSGNVVVRMS